MSNEFWSAIAGASVTIALGGVFVSSAMPAIIATDSSFDRLPKIKAWPAAAVLSAALILAVWVPSGVALWSALDHLRSGDGPSASAGCALWLVIGGFGVMAVTALVAALAATAQAISHRYPQSSDELDP